MSVNGLNVTAVGWAATDPREVVGDKVAFTSFRLATTPRRFDNRNEGWVDGRTEWITVKLFREPAMNVAESVRKGQPLIVHGRLHTEEWTTDGVTRTGLVLEAAALGHDLTRGRAVFVRRTYKAGAAEGGDGNGNGNGGDGGRGPDAGPSVEPDPWAAEASPLPDDPDDAPGRASTGEPLDADVALATS